MFIVAAKKICLKGINRTINEEGIVAQMEKRESFKFKKRKNMTWLHGINEIGLKMNCILWICSLMCLNISIAVTNLSPHLMQGLSSLYSFVRINPRKENFKSVILTLSKSIKGN